MPKGGHNRKPKTQKIIQGTFRSDRNPKNEPEPEKLTEAPRPPSSLNKFGKRLWKTITPKLIDLGVLTDLDLPVLEMACEAWGDYKDLKESILKPINPETGKREKQTLGEYMKGRNSQTMPEYTAMKQLYQIFKSYMAEFGVTPVSRNRITIVPKKEEKDPMEELLENEG